MKKYRVHQTISIFVEAENDIEAKEKALTDDNLDGWNKWDIEECDDIIDFYPPKIKGEPFTKFEELLISVIDNFILWNTTESDRGIAEEYIANEHIDYDDWLIEFLKKRIKK
tara:strand:+ start:482 stop:817 length:336 start_codon:yes stop_codon:yes gene_type:complete